MEGHGTGNRKKVTLRPGENPRHRIRVSGVYDTGTYVHRTSALGSLGIKLVTPSGDGDAYRNYPSLAVILAYIMLFSIPAG